MFDPCKFCLLPVAKEMGFCEYCIHSRQKQVGDLSLKQLEKRIKMRIKELESPDGLGEAEGTPLEPYYRLCWSERAEELKQ